MKVEIPEGLVQPTVQLIGQDGNAFAIMGRTTDALKKAGNDKAIVDSYLSQAQSGDYDHLLKVTLAFIEHGDDDWDGEEVDDAYDD